jgi:hypothetical protein
MHDQHKLISILALLLTFLSAAPALGQDHREPTRLSFWIVGRGGETAIRFGTDLGSTLADERRDTEPILLCIAERPLSADAIAARTKLSRARVLGLLARLQALHLVKEEDKARWVTTIPVITDGQTKRIRKSLTPMARDVARKVAADAPALTASYESVKSTTDPAWQDIAHLVIDTFLVDGSFRQAVDRLELERGIHQRYYNHDQEIIPAFFLERGEHFSTFGTNGYVFENGGEQRQVYVLHGAVLKRYDIRMGSHERDPVLSAALFRLTPAGGTESLTRNEMETLRALGWIEKEHLQVPVIQAKTVKALMPLVEKIGADAGNVVFHEYSGIIKAFDHSPYSRFEHSGGDYIQACYHVLFDLVLEQLAATGVLSAFPRPAPEHFGVYIIMGQLP